MLKYIESSPSHIAGMAIFLICMIAFILWVTTFRTRTRDIIKHKNIFFGISGVIIVLCLGTFLFKGLNWGLDFTGGTQLQIAIKPEYNTAQVREAVTEYASKNPELQKKFDDAKVQLEENIKENVTLNDNSNVFAQETPAAPPVAGQPAPGAPAAPPVAGQPAPGAPAAPPVAGQPAPGAPAAPPVAGQPAPGAPAAPPVEGQPAPGAPAAPPAGQPAPNATDVAPVGQPAPGAPVVATPAAPATETAPAAVPSPDAKDDKKAKEEESPKPVKMAKFKKCIIQCKPLSSDEVNGLMVFLQNKLGDVELLKLETVGPTIGQDLSRKGLLALLIALGAQLLYITFRFGTQFRYGVAADIALLHDLIVMVGLYSLLGRPIDSNFLAALLTIVGYSVMDSVVVFDRIRENLHIMKGKSYEETVNLSLNQTITRSALASMTVIMSAFAIYFFGGATLNSFAIALLIGLITGTYSSLFVASPILIVIDDWAKSSEKQRVDARRKKLQDEADAKAQSKSETTEKKSIKSDITPQDYPTPGEVSDNKDEISGGRRVKGERKRRR